MTDYVISGGQTSSGIVLNNGDTLAVLAGGTAVSTTISSGGLETISSGGLDFYADIGPGNSGGQQIVEVGGVASGAVIGRLAVGGAATSSPDQIVFGTVVSTVDFATGGGLGGIQVQNSGIAIDTRVVAITPDSLGRSLAAGVLWASAGGSASGTIVSGQGTQEVLDSGSFDQNVTIGSGGSVLIFPGGTIFGATVMSAASLNDAGMISGLVVSSGGFAEVDFPGALALATVVLSGANLIVADQGVASGTLISGGTESVTFVTHDSGAISVGIDIGATVVGGGALLVSAGGVVSNVSILSGGTLRNGGIVSGATIGSGGVAVTLGTGTIQGTVTVSSGGTVNGVNIGSTGTVDLKSGAIVDDVTFSVASGGRLVIEDTASPTFQVFGFVSGDSIDLPNVSFNSSGTVNLEPGNLLHVVENGGAFNIQLDRSTRFLNAFSMVADTSGGTIINALPAAPLAGQLLFISGGFSPLAHLDLNSATASAANSLNIEVFTGLSVGDTLPPLPAGYQAGVLDPGGFVADGIFLTGPVQLLGGNYEVLDTANLFLTGSNSSATKPTSITLGSGNQTVVGAIGDTLIGGSGNQVFNALAANELVSGSTGASTVFGGVGDTIVAAGPAYIDGLAGHMNIAIGSSGTDTIFSGAGDTITGGAATAVVNLASGGVANLIQQTGTAAINAIAGGSQITLGGGTASVFGGSGDTIVGGTVGQYIDATAGKVRIGVGADGVDTVFGSTVAGAGDTIVGGAGALLYNAGAGELIDLSGGTGTAVINAIGGLGAPANDTITAGSGSTSVWGGAGDRIGVGTASSAAGAQLWGHSTTVPAAVVGFGTNDTVIATSYDTTAGSASVNSTVVGASTAKVTIGAGAGNFDSLHDFIFYPNETSTTNSAIVATTQAINGGTSTALTLPDGTVMTLAGITQAQIAAALIAGTLFKP